MLRVEGFLERRSPAFVVLLGVLLVALVALVDAVTGEFAVSVLFLVPVSIVTFSRGRGMGLVAPMRDALRWQRELAHRESESADQLRALNELRDALQHPDDVPAENLHALSELRDSLERLDVAS